MNPHWRQIWNSIIAGVVSGIFLIIIGQDNIVEYVGGKIQITTIGLILIIGLFYILYKNR